jgi:hypothetical protein
MALVAYDGFDNYASGNDALNRRGGGLQWNQTTGGAIFAPGRNNYGQCYRLGQNTNLLGTLTAPLTEGYFGFAMNLTSPLYPGNPSLRLMDNHGPGDLQQLRFVFNQLRAGIDVYRDATLVAASINNSFTLDGWNFIEFHVKIDGGTGLIRIRSNGQDVLNVSGINTQAVTASGHNYFEGIWFYGAGAPTGTAFDIDDFYVADTTTGPGVFPFNFFAGDARVVTLHPIGDVGTPGWTLSVAVPTAHRFWRLVVNGWASGWPQIGEVQFRTTAGVDEPLTGGTAQESTGQGGAGAAADNNPTTFYSPISNPPIWWQYDFGAGHTHLPAEVMLRCSPNPGSNPTDFSLQWSDDGITFTFAAHYTARWTTPLETKTFMVWTTNWMTVNDIVADGDLGYNYTSTVSAKDMFNFEPLAATITAVLAVQVVGCYRKDDAGTRTVEQHLSSAGTEVAAAAYSIPAGYVYCSDFFTLDPATSNAWTVSAVNALQAGYVLAS